MPKATVVRYLKMLEDAGLDTMHRQTLDLFSKLITTVRARLTRIKTLVPDRLKDAHAALDRLNDGLSQAIRYGPDMLVRFFDNLLQKIKAIFSGPRLETAMSGPTNSTLIRRQARADVPKLEMTGGTVPKTTTESKINADTITDKKKTYGSAANPRVEWRKNKGGVIRKKEEAIEETWNVSDELILKLRGD